MVLTNGKCSRTLLREEKRDHLFGCLFSGDRWHWSGRPDGNECDDERNCDHCRASEQRIGATMRCSDAREGCDAKSGASLLHCLQHSRSCSRVTSRNTCKDRDAQGQETGTGANSKEHQRTEEAEEVPLAWGCLRDPERRHHQRRESE
jgi:hypothetical protein